MKTLNDAVVTWLFGCALCACDRTASAGLTHDENPSRETGPYTAIGRVLEDPGTEGSREVVRAVAVLHPISGSSAQGVVTFSARETGGIDVTTELRGLTPGKHGYHVHQFGDCSGDDGKAAGTHFNFAGSSEHPGANIDRITGNLGELHVGTDGMVKASATIMNASLQGGYSLVGRAVVVHENGNDYQHRPLGAAGRRVACGVIGIAEAKTTAQKTVADSTTISHGG